ncbi:hypothetical protein [Leuconostoc citreum]
MKIVSLQSVGLGTIFSGINEPYTIKVGENLYDGRGYSLDVTVTKIEFGFEYQGTGLPAQPDTYFVHTSDGHVRVLPEDKYIAEWSE